MEELELERNELEVCPLCGVAPTIDLGFDSNRKYIVEVKCAHCDVEVVGDNIETARTRWSEYAVKLNCFLKQMGYTRR